MIGLSPFLWAFLSMAVHKTAKETQYGKDFEIGRGAFLRQPPTVAAATALLSTTAVPASATVAVTDLNQAGTKQKDRPEITIPLEPSGGGTLAVRWRVKPIRAKETASGDFRIVRAIVDTGSPYLVLPSGEDWVANDYNAIASPDAGAPLNTLFHWIPLLSWFLTPRARQQFWFRESGFGPTEEVYGAVKGRIDWKSVNADVPRAPELQSVAETSRVVVGVLDSNLTQESGGALFGLIQDINPNANPQKYQARPTVLQQLQLSQPSLPQSTTKTSSAVRSFIVDAPNYLLTLSTRDLIVAAVGATDDNKLENVESSTTTIPLVDLRPLGDFVDHYALLVEDFVINRNPAWSYTGGCNHIQDANLGNKRGATRRPIVAVFDTGLTGCVVTRDLWNELVMKSSSPRAKSGNNKWPHPSQYNHLSIRVTTQHPQIGSTFETKRSNDFVTEKRIEAGAKYKMERFGAPFYVAPIDLDWFDNDDTPPHVIVLGQTFLARGALTIDIPTRRATFNVK
jgi:hypothetical protein